MTRCAPAADPVEWDLFRTGVLEKQGWKFHRIWSPALYSDPDRHKRAIALAAQNQAAINVL
jgi:very-short-patch-repair endonuclease